MYLDHSGMDRSLQPVHSKRHNCICSRNKVRNTTQVLKIGLIYIQQEASHLSLHFISVRDIESKVRINITGGGGI